MLPIFSGSLIRQLLGGAVAVGLTAAVALTGLMVISPDARAQVQDLVVRLVEVDSPWELLPLPADAEAPRSPGPPSGPEKSPGAGTGAEVPAPSDIPLPPLPKDLASRGEQALVSLEAVQAQTSFTIKMPAALPEGYSLKGALKPPPAPPIEKSPPADGPVLQLPSVVTLIFEDGAGEMLMLSEASLAAPDLGEKPLPGEIPLPVGKGSVQEVTVNGQPGQYVEGAWTPEGWNASASHHQLHWQGADGLTYTLLSRMLGLSELLAMAESIP